MSNNGNIRAMVEGILGGGDNDSHGVDLPATGMTKPDATEFNHTHAEKIILPFSSPSDDFGMKEMIESFHDEWHKNDKRSFTWEYKNEATDLWMEVQYTYSEKMMEVSVGNLRTDGSPIPAPHKFGVDNNTCLEISMKVGALVIDWILNRSSNRLSGFPNVAIAMSETLAISYMFNLLAVQYHRTKDTVITREFHTVVPTGINEETNTIVTEPVKVEMTAELVERDGDIFPLSLTTKTGNYQKRAFAVSPKGRDHSMTTNGMLPEYLTKNLFLGYDWSNSPISVITLPDTQGDFNTFNAEVLEKVLDDSRQQSYHYLVTTVERNEVSWKNVGDVTKCVYVNGTMTLHTPLYEKPIVIRPDRTSTSSIKKSLQLAAEVITLGSYHCNLVND